MKIRLGTAVFLDWLQVASTDPILMVSLFLIALLICSLSVSSQFIIQKGVAWADNYVRVCLFERIGPLRSNQSF